MKGLNPVELSTLMYPSVIKKISVTFSPLWITVFPAGALIVT
jgi:hypothetical protein